jgi:hypothetical protein
MLVNLKYNIKATRALLLPLIGDAIIHSALSHDKTWPLELRAQRYSCSTGASTPGMPPSPHSFWGFTAGTQSVPDLESLTKQSLMYGGVVAGLIWAEAIQLLMVYLIILSINHNVIHAQQDA